MTKTLVHQCDRCGAKDHRALTGNADDYGIPNAWARVERRWRTSGPTVHERVNLICKDCNDVIDQLMNGADE